ncbi:hypothetical protein [Candidatus Entotheonella palauensis]|uniref:hypothetical protein n=1 Tax=Candidatus Entotheonella palauensis TaxID=93172 RepID=UPI0004B63D01|nr:hypothetical protein [Candidatus Entotheonella palauensis]
MAEATTQSYLGVRERWLTTALSNWRRTRQSAATDETTATPSPSTTGVTNPSAS